MLAAERQERILAALARHPAVRVVDLAEELDASEMTIRRDIDALAAAAKLRRVHGGAARLTGQSAAEPGFSVKSNFHSAAKAAIAAEAAQLVEPGMSVAISAGTTTAALAAELANIPDLLVVTNSLPAAAVLHHLASPPTVLLTGGARTPSEALVGPLAVANLTGLNVDICFMGAHGVSQSGLSTPNLLEAATNTALVASASRLVVLADSSKLGVRALSYFARLDEVDQLITDASLADLADYPALQGRVTHARTHRRMETP